QASDRGMLVAPEAAEQLDELFETAARVGSRHDLCHALHAAAASAIIEQGFEQPTAGAELVVDGEAGHACSARYGLERQRPALGSHQLDRCTHQPLPGALSRGVAFGTRVGSGWHCRYLAAGP